MAWQIIKQKKTDVKLDGDELEEGLYAIFSSVVDAFIFYNATKEEIIQYYLEAETARLRQGVLDKFELIEAGKPAYHQFSRSFEDCLADTLVVEAENNAGEDEED